MSLLCETLHTTSCSTLTYLSTHLSNSHSRYPIFQSCLSLCVVRQWGSVVLQHSPPSRSTSIALSTLSIALETAVQERCNKRSNFRERHCRLDFSGFSFEVTSRSRMPATRFRSLSQHPFEKVPCFMLPSDSKICELRICRTLHVDIDS